MRSKKQIDYLKKSHSDATILKYNLSHKLITQLLDFYFSSNSTIVKNTGPKILKIEESNSLLLPIIKSIKKEIGEFRIRYAHIFDVSFPHIIHNDDTNEYPSSYKAFTIPLKIYGQSNDISLVVFDQYYYGGAVKFVQGDHIDKETKIYYNQYLTNYNDVEGLNSKGIDDKIKKKYLSHLQNSWLEGLSINKMLPWKVGSILCFDSLALHCSTDFRNVNVQRKIGLSIFTLID